eukprot:GHVS01105807.1.p1 GENE.GHVS01105807.1~~GHVS01105807.1.p1  ORF type:complete len:331 (+),score=111.63 GHVS01105807.1:256-1248(+)
MRLFAIVLAVLLVASHNAQEVRSIDLAGLDLFPVGEGDMKTRHEKMSGGGGGQREHSLVWGKKKEVVVQEDMEDDRQGGEELVLDQKKSKFQTLLQNEGMKGSKLLSSSYSGAKKNETVKRKNERPLKTSNLLSVFSSSNSAMPPSDLSPKEETYSSSSSSMPVTTTHLQSDVVERSDEPMDLPWSWSSTPVLPPPPAVAFSNMQHHHEQPWGGEQYEAMESSGGPRQNLEGGGQMNLGHEVGVKGGRGGGEGGEVPTTTTTTHDHHHHHHQHEEVVVVEALHPPPPHMRMTNISEHHLSAACPSNSSGQDVNGRIGRRSKENRTWWEVG